MLDGHADAERQRGLRPCRALPRFAQLIQARSAAAVAVAAQPFR